MSVIENLPTLNIAQLRGDGLFAEGGIGHVGYRLDHDVKIVIQRGIDCDTLTLTWSAGKEYFQQLVSVRRVQLTYGQRRYFVCPHSGDNCTKLLLIRNRFASRLALNRGTKPGQIERSRLQFQKKVDRLTGRDGRKPARGKAVKDIVMGMQDDPWLHLADPTFAQALATARVGYRQINRNKTRSSVHRGRYACGPAFAAGTEVAPDSGDYWTERRRQVPAEILRALPDLSREVAEAHPALTMRGLKSANLLLAGQTRARTLLWPDRPGLIVEGHREDPDFSYVIVRPIDSSEPGQLIRLKPNATGRLYMVCPVFGENYSTLYLRNGLFASKKACRLVSRSQLKTAV